MRDKLYRFMQGRNGMDDLCRMESGLVLVLLILGIFTRLGIFTTVALLLMIHMYYRALSKNTAKRYEENQKYLNFKYNRTVSWNRFKKRMAQTRDYATKKKGKTEVQPFWNMSDIKNVVEWFEKNNEWDGYLITLLELLLGRRIGDTVMMKWSDLYYENGNRKSEIDTIEEQKTGKITNLPVSNMVWEAVDNYLSHVKIDPMEHYNEYIFSYIPKTLWLLRHPNTPFYMNIETWCGYLNKDFSDKRKQKILDDFHKQKEYKSLGDYLYYIIEYNDVVKWQTDDYRKKLKKAVEDVGIRYPISSHSLRKSFGYWIHKTHPFDPDCLLSLQKLFNHTDLQMTMNYIGLTEEKNRQLINDHGEFIHNVLAGKGDEIVKNMPVVSLKSDDFGKIIRMLTDDVDKYQAAINMANELRIL